MPLERISDDRGAITLANLLNGDRRRRPVVVVTIPTGRAEPYIDAEAVVQEVGDLAAVYLIATGHHTWTFSGKMPDLTQVYGGAGRVYPVGHEWVSNPYVSPLRFAYNAEEGQRATRAIISDALRMAAAAGLVHRGRARNRTRVEAVVAGIPVPERALVKFDGRMANVAQELTVPNVALDRVLSVGMRVNGWFDSETRRFDIAEELLDPATALQPYREGDLVLVQVRSVTADEAELLLHPQVPVRIGRSDVTTNELDDLRSLLTPDEVLSARVVSGGTEWHLTLLDVDDDETPVTAVSLLAGGPPWLQPPPREDNHQWPDETTTAALPPQEAVTADVPDVGDTSTQVTLPSATPQASPAVLAKRVPTDTPASAPSTTASMGLTIDALRSTVAALESDLEGLREQIRAGNAERATLVDIRQQLERTVGRLEHELQQQRARLRRTKQKVRPDKAIPEFADAEQGFRYSVLTAWATRTPAAEQEARPLPEYDVGPEFLGSLRQTDGVAPEKVAHVVMEILTGRAQELAGRDLHQMRESRTPNAPYVRRTPDGATCWRAALQINTPQARRIHYWVLPGGKIELSRVALHDDFRP